MTIHTTLTAVADLLRQADPQATVRSPAVDGVGLCIWPWRYVSVPSNAIPTRRVAPPPPTPFDLRILVVPRPAMSIDDLDVLDRVLATVTAGPVLPLADGTVRLALDTALSSADLSSLFSAAGARQVLCIELVARFGPK